ncbi:unnamed protein product [Medioppia subpectinata]|uniref:Uncharacterized protein n=1 Tax=Medioppia subpectinata TaxID=1979941 RepID=A0A7R9KNB4_9ACAR|nr:unnamed protein product [Medioppia subpectinata]CAG2106423.1 unnamed protein product [Medioppia subpectinata]
MAYLAAGAEFDSDEEFDDFLDDSYVRREEEVSYKKTETPKPKPKRNVVLESISCGAIFLNDIRMAIINDNFGLLKELMESESNVFVDTILTAGWTALMYASNSGHKLMVHYLLERGADPNFHKDNWTPLMAVCGASNGIPEEDLIECAKYLLKFGANVNALDNYGNSALIYAAKTGKCGQR